MSKNITVSDVINFIRNPQLDPNDRILIVESLHMQAASKRAQARAGLLAGMKVTFFSGNAGRQVVGTITKVNRVNVDLTEDGTGTRWRVSPGLLKRV